MSSSSWLFVFLLRASGHVATVQGATAPASSLVALSQLTFSFSECYPTLASPSTSHYSAHPDLPELAAHIGRLEFISEGFDLCKNPSVGQKIGDAPHSPVPSLSPVTLGKYLRVLRGTLRSLATGKLGPSLTPGAAPTRPIGEPNERVSLCARSLCKHPRSHRLLVAFISSPNCATYRSYQVGHVNRNYIL